MSESLSQVDELREQLDTLKSIIDAPQIYLSTYFSSLKSEVSSAFTCKLEQTTDPLIKLRIDENWLKLNEKIHSFESECSMKFAFNETTTTNATIDSISLKLDNYNDNYYAEISDLIYDETHRIEKMLFLNKTMIFLDKSKCRQIETNSDDFSPSRSNVSDDSNESFNEDVNLFYYMNNKTTAGKLVFITNEYFGKRTLPILKYGSDCSQDRLTSEIIKCIELRKRMEKSLTKSQIDELAFDMPNLNKIDFSFYELKSIEASIFRQSFTRLKWINLSDNELNSLDKDIFIDLFDLRSVSLASNKLKTIHSGLFRSNTKLNEINLADNELEQLDPRLFNGLTRLELIYLNKNRLKKIDATLFVGLIELKWLYLDNNQIESLDSATFNGLTKLIEINLSENRLTSLHASLFAGLNDLEDVNLRFNQIKEISSSLFQGLFKLTSLDVSNNELVSVDAGQFKGLAELAFLNLSSNKIELFDENLFNNLTKIKSIDLSYNNSSTISDNNINSYLNNTYFSNLPIKW